MQIQDYLHKRFSRVSDFYTAETAELILSCSKDQPVFEILEYLAEPTQASMAVVNDQGSVIGIISERDVIRHIAVHKSIVNNVTVADIMTIEPITVELSSSCVGALRAMLDGNFRNMPVCCEGKFVGILSVLEAAKGRLIATATKSQDLFSALAVLNNDFPCAELQNDSDDAFDDFRKSRKNIMLVTENGEPIDYLTSIEMTRLRLQTMGTHL